MIKLQHLRDKIGNKRVIRTMLLITVSLLGSQITNAEPKSFQILDANGKPLADAVVSWSAEGSQKTQEQAIDYEIMDQVDKAFMPEVLVIESGSVVSFPNSDSIHHHVYSFSTAKTFEIGLYSGEEAAPVQFDTPGVVVLGCNIHDVMLGYIYVNDSMNHAKSDEQGYVTVDIPSSAMASVKVWHVNMATEGNVMAVDVAQVQQNANTLRIPVTPAPEVRTASTPLEQRFESLRKRRNDS